MNLFEIEQEYRLLMEDILANDGEITDEQFEQLNINRNELEDKLTAYQHIRLELKGEVDTLKSEIERLNSKLKSRENLDNRLKDMMSTALNLYGEEQYNKDGSFKNKVLKFGSYKLFSVYHKPVKVEDEVKLLEEHPELFKYKLPSLDKDLYDKVKAVIDVEVEPILNKIVLKEELSKSPDLFDQDCQPIEGAYIDKQAFYIKIS